MVYCTVDLDKICQIMEHLLEHRAWQEQVSIASRRMEELEQHIADCSGLHGAEDFMLDLYIRKRYRVRAVTRAKKALGLNIRDAMTYVDERLNR